MAGKKFNIVSGHSIDNSAIDSNGRYNIYTSEPTDNSSGQDGYVYDALRVVVNYEDLTPSPDTSFEVQAIVESSNGETGGAERWFPIAYQFDTFYRNDYGPSREIILQPNLVVIDMGVDDIVWVGNEFEAAISRQQGKLGTDFRVRIALNENGHGTPQAFQSMNLSIFGEMFNANS